MVRFIRKIIAGGRVAHVCRKKLGSGVPLDKSEGGVKDKDVLGGAMSTAVFAREG
jgi:hypothetical protein